MKILAKLHDLQRQQCKDLKGIANRFFSVKNYDEVFKRAMLWEWLCKAEKPSSGFPASEAQFLRLLLASCAAVSLW